MIHVGKTGIIRDHMLLRRYHPACNLCSSYLTPAEVNPVNDKVVLKYVLFIRSTGWNTEEFVNR